MPPLRHAPVGHPTRRANRVIACAPYTAAMVVEEEKLYRRATTAVVVCSPDQWYPSPEVIKEAVAEQLLIPAKDMEFSALRPLGYLVLFSDSRLRDHAIAQPRGVALDDVTVHFLPCAL